MAINLATTQAQSLNRLYGTYGVTGSSAAQYRHKVAYTIPDKPQPSNWLAWQLFSLGVSLLLVALPVLIIIQIIGWIHG